MCKWHLSKSQFNHELIRQGSIIQSFSIQHYKCSYWSTSLTSMNHGIWNILLTVERMLFSLPVHFWKNPLLSVHFCNGQGIFYKVVTFPVLLSHLLSATEQYFLFFWRAAFSYFLLARFPVIYFLLATPAQQKTSKGVLLLSQRYKFGLCSKLVWKAILRQDQCLHRTIRCGSPRCALILFTSFFLHNFISYLLMANTVSDSWGWTELCCLHQCLRAVSTSDLT